MELIQLGENSRDGKLIDCDTNPEAKKSIHGYFPKAFSQFHANKLVPSQQVYVLRDTTAHPGHVTLRCDFSLWSRDMTGRDEHLLIKGRLFLLHTCNLNE